MEEGDGGRNKRQIIGMEQFLPRRSLRVLLVEADDSTRHIVTALLRKCGYHVAAVADGMKAWEVMLEKHYNFDLVLTEVDMPLLSGIGLLSKIMAADECKNIPVIMMSSQDSIGVVLKCMLKGAVDFLVKPVRKNELRNLWQHVWRRQYSNASENNAASNNMSGNARATSDNGENSEDSDAQNLGRKPEIEIQSARKHSDTNANEAGNSFREVEAKREQPDDVVKVTSNTIDLKKDDGPKIADDATTEINRPCKKTSLTEKHHDNNCSYIPLIREEQQGSLRSNGDVDPKPFHDNDSVKLVRHFIEPIHSQRCTSAALDRVAFRQDGHFEASSSLHPRGTSDPGSSPLLELSLRKAQVSDFVNPDFKEKCILRHSNSSAFSRWYGDKRRQHADQDPVSSPFHLRARESINYTDSNIGSLVPSAEVTNSLSPQKMFPLQEKTVEGTSYFPKSYDCNKEETCLVSSSKGSDSLCHPQIGLFPVPIPVGAIPYQNFAGFSAPFQPVIYPKTSFHLNNSTSFEKTSVEFPSTQHSHTENHCTDVVHSTKYHCHLENPQSRQWKQQIDVELRNLEGSSSTPIDQVNLKAGCGQDFRKETGDNACDETTDFQKVTGDNACDETTDDVVNVANALESGNESGVQKYNSKVEGDWSRREAALMKFRLKRKERCFEKKVRYHSRKKLAEQRPRVKGQFVRQKISSTSTATEAEG